MIYALSQSTGIPAYDILYKWSFENVLLLSRAVPSYSVDEEQDGNEDKWDEIDRFKWNPKLDANDPDNFVIKPNSNIEDEEFVI